MPERADPHDRVRNLEICLCVPGQRGEAITKANTESREQRRDPQAALHEIGIGDSVRRAVLARTYDLPLRVPFCHVLPKKLLSVS